MIYKAVAPKDVRVGDRLLFLGTLHVVADIPRCSGEGHTIQFKNGMQRQFVNDVCVVDEDRTARMLARYAPVAVGAS
jgi:hypothetical protein